MSDGTHISWAEATWNVVTGCTKVSDACTHCYIDRTPPLRMAHRRFRHPDPVNGSPEKVGATTGVLLHPERLGIPFGWRKPRRIFVCSLADLFHDDVPDDHIAETFAVAALNPRHTFQVLTKRHARLRALLSSDAFTARVADHAYLMAMGEHPNVTGPALRAAAATYDQWAAVADLHLGRVLPWPLPNVWVGVTAESQQWADTRVPVLLDTPAAVRWVSAEPLLGPLDLTRYLIDEPPGLPGDWPRCVDWVVAGGESGPKARPMHPQWARGLRDQCAAAGVAFHFKQWGEWAPVIPDVTANRRHTDWIIRPDGRTWPLAEPCGLEVGHTLAETPTIRRVGKRAAGRELDGAVHDAYPDTADTRTLETTRA